MARLTDEEKAAQYEARARAIRAKAAVKPLLKTLGKTASAWAAGKAPLSDVNAVIAQIEIALGNA